MATLEQLSLREELSISPQQWQQMQQIIRSEQSYVALWLSDDLEFRFVPMEQGQSFSALLSYRGLDVYHFMWTEVEGLADLTHRIVNPRFRGQGIGSQVMQALQDRLQARANREDLPYHLMIETSQLSVVGLGLKKGLQLSKGQDLYAELQAEDHHYSIDDNTHVSDANNYRQTFRLSQRFEPLSESIRHCFAEIRGSLSQVVVSS